MKLFRPNYYKGTSEPRSLRLFWAALVFTENKAYRDTYQRYLSNFQYQSAPHISCKLIKANPSKGN